MQHMLLPPRQSCERGDVLWSKMNRFFLFLQNTRASHPSIMFKRALTIAGNEDVSSTSVPISTPFLLLCLWNSVDVQKPPPKLDEGWYQPCLQAEDHQLGELPHCDLRFYVSCTSS